MTRNGTKLATAPALQHQTKKRKTYGLSVDRELMMRLQHLSVDEEKWTNEMLEEAIRDLLKKYRRKPESPQ